MPKGQTFINQEIHLDEQEFIGCTFRDCTIVYSGGGGCTLVDCEFHECAYQFRGAALRTVNFMRALYQMGGGVQSLIENTLAEIRKPLPRDPSPRGGE
jgi:hypothetical protein